MMSDLEKLTQALGQGTFQKALEAQIQSRRGEIEQALKQKKEYVLTDHKGRTFHIVAADGKPDSL